MMAKIRRKSTKDSLRTLMDLISEEATRLGAAAGDNRWPIPLSPVAREAGVAALIFEPLFSTAGLEDLGNSYVIWINADAQQADAFPTGKRIPLDGVAWVALKSHLRLIVAHEIAHALFINEARRQQRPPPAVDGELEMACYDIARLILLPTQLMMSILTGNIFQLDTIADAILTAQVSADVFLRRLKMSDMSSIAGNGSGVLALVRKTERGLSVIDNHAWGTQAVVRFGAHSKGATDEKKSQLLTIWGITDKGGLWEEAKSEVELDITSGSSSVVLPCRICVRRLHNSPQTFLMSIHILALPKRLFS